MELSSSESQLAELDRKLEKIRLELGDALGNYDPEELKLLGIEYLKVAKATTNAHELGIAEAAGHKAREIFLAQTQVLDLLGAPNLAASCRQIAETLRTAGKLAEAIPYIDDACMIYGDLAVRSEDYYRVFQAETALERAILGYSLNDGDAAQEAARTVLRLLEPLQDRGNRNRERDRGDIRRTIGQAYEILAYTERDRGNVKKAAELQLLAVERHDSGGDASPQPRLKSAEMRLNAAQCLVEIQDWERAKAMLHGAEERVVERDGEEIIALNVLRSRLRVLNAMTARGLGDHDTAYQEILAAIAVLDSCFAKEPRLFARLSATALVEFNQICATRRRKADTPEMQRLSTKLRTFMGATRSSD